MEWKLKESHGKLWSSLMFQAEQFFPGAGFQIKRTEQCEDLRLSLTPTND